MTDKVV